MKKLTITYEKANHYMKKLTVTDVRADPNYRKDSLFKQFS